MSKVYVIGCGGIGGWVAQGLSKTLDESSEMVLIDADKIEKRNLDRQLFTRKDINSFKCDALANALKQSRCKISTVPHFIGGVEPVEFDPGAYVIVGVDNHPARAKTLALCDDVNAHCICAANGYDEAEAYYYNPTWFGTNKDPRQYYPEILTDQDDDPLSPPCTGEELEASPQLAIANMNAASHGLWLYWFWTQVAEKITCPDAQTTCPVLVRSTSGRMNVQTLGDFDPKEEE